MKITEYGIKAVGHKDMKAHENGKTLSYKQACMAKCYDCMTGYIDGKVDCGICGCPLYSKMPYKNVKECSGDSEKRGLHE